MKLSELKKNLEGLDGIGFRLEDGSYVPSHFHITELGEITKKFIDCGGTVREEKAISLQLWTANDTEHRLTAEKLMKIITIAESKLVVGNHDIEVEYQGNTIGKYALGFDGADFMLMPKQTACLAEDACGIPVKKQKIKLSQVGAEYTPGGGCC